MRLLSATRIVRVSLALAVAFWMAGAGCLLGCGGMTSAAVLSNIETPKNSTVIVATGSACASMHSSHDCCAKNGPSVSKATSKPVSDKPQLVANPREKIEAEAYDKLKFVEELPATMMDCPLAVSATAALSKAGPDQSNVALSSTSGRTALSNSLERNSAFARPLRPPNRGHTYLLCCVFLI
jgi:hypothetical protein